MKTAKQELLEVLEREPDDAPMDSLLAQRGEGISDEELEDRLNRWRESSGRRKLSVPSVQ